MLKNSEFFKKRNDENKHIIEQLVSFFDDKDRNIDELKRDLDDALNKTNNLNYEIKNKDISKNKIYEELQKIENNNQQLEKFIEVFDNVVKEDNDKIYNMLNKFKKYMKTGISNLHEEAINKMNKFDVKLNKLENNIGEIDNCIKKNNKRKLDVANTQYSNLLLEYNKSKNELMEIIDKFNKTKDKLDKAKDNINKKKYTNKIEEIEKEIKYKNDKVINLENKLSKKNKYIKDLEKSIKREIKKNYPHHLLALVF